MIREQHRWTQQRVYHKTCLASSELSTSTVLRLCYWKQIWTINETYIQVSWPSFYRVKNVRKDGKRRTCISSFLASDLPYCGTIIHATVSRTPSSSKLCDDGWTKIGAIYYLYPNEFLFKNGWPQSHRCCDHWQWPVDHLKIKRIKYSDTFSETWFGFVLKLCT